MTKHVEIVFGDLHLDESSYQECYQIVNEICKYDAHSITQLGDLCDKNRLNAIELDALTDLCVRIRDRYSNFNIITGNHDLYDKDNSIIRYLHYLDINLIPTDEAVINDTLFGHYFTDKSKDSFGKYKKTLEEIKLQGRRAFLGHQHDFQTLEDNYYHLGSVRYTSFAEDENLYKRIAIIENDKVNFIKLNSVIPIRNIYDLNTLSQINKKTKVRYIIKTFSQLKDEINILNSKKAEYNDFKIKLDFRQESKSEVIKEKSDIKTFVYNWINSVADEEIRNILEEEFTGALK